MSGRATSTDLRLLRRFLAALGYTWAMIWAGLMLLGALAVLAALRFRSGPAPAVGSPAPDFTLPCQDSSTVSLASLRGQWVVLYFYPKDKTPG